MDLTPIILLGLMVFGGFGLISILSNNMSLNNIKSRKVGDGQYGTARFATAPEIKRTFAHVAYTPHLWRQGKNLPTDQGVILGGKYRGKKVTALIDSDDVHTMMIGAAGVGKTAFFLYPNLEYACASGMSFLTTDTKGDLYRNYAGIAKDYYSYKVTVLDLRNPTRSDGCNLLQLVNKYMDIYLNTGDLPCKSKAEKYAKIISKTIINAGGGTGDYGQNSYFYDSAEGILTAAILLISESCPPEKRHIISVFKLIQDLMAPSNPSKSLNKSQNKFQELIEMLPPEHKARWFAGAALNSSTQGMASVLSTAMSRLNAFLDSELEQILCFDSAIDAEQFCNRKSAIFIVLPEEDNSVTRS